MSAPSPGVGPAAPGAFPRPHPRDSGQGAQPSPPSPAPGQGEPVPFPSAPPLPLRVAPVEEDEIAALHALGAGEAAPRGVAERAPLHRHIETLGVLLGAPQSPGPGAAAPARPRGLRPAAAGSRHVGAAGHVGRCCRALWEGALRRRAGAGEGAGRAALRRQNLDFFL